MVQLSDVLSAIDARKATLDALRPLSSATAGSLRTALALEWTYHSNAIEGNTLTLRETRVVLEGITIGAVEDLQGISWTEVQITGQSNHAGTTPMRMRHDAGYCAAAIGMFVRQLVQELGGNQVGTVGSMLTLTAILWLFKSGTLPPLLGRG